MTSCHVLRQLVRHLTVEIMKRAASDIVTTEALMKPANSWLARCIAG
jgi:hypothetical protein